MCINCTKCKVCRPKMVVETEEAIKNAKKQLKKLTESSNFSQTETIKLMDSIEWMEKRLGELQNRGQ